MDDNRSWKLGTGVEFQSLGHDEDGVLLSLTNGYLYRCNHTASILLAGIEMRSTLAQIISHLCREFGIPEQT
jgi:hypothetical protein